MQENAVKPITVTVSRACELTGLGRTSIYEALKDERLQSVTIGRRRLILYSSLEALVAPEAV